jgi:uncharacterized repeat protein (TIGR04138 family)
VREALDHTQKLINKATKSESRAAADEPAEGKVRHVTGQELLAGIRSYALDQYGPMTLTVLGEWGVRRCEDFGEIVFNMVENHLLAKTKKDSREDFKGGYDFEEAFRRPYLPEGRKEAAAAEAKS